MDSFHLVLALLAHRVVPFAMLFAMLVLVLKRGGLWAAIALLGTVAVAVGAIADVAMPRGISIHTVDGSLKFSSLGQALAWTAYVPLPSLGAILVAVGLVGYALKKPAT